jgi:iron(III) transport system ATP-binding protein
MEQEMNRRCGGLSLGRVTATVGEFRLARLDLDVRAGEILAVVGPSGSGKSTLLHTVAGFIPSHGRVSVDGEDVSTMPPQGRSMGLVFQHPVLLPGLNVRENVGYGLDDTRMPEEKRDDLIDIAMVNLRVGSLSESTPNNLSGGESQRVALAQAVVRKPRVLLLDEPLSHVEASLRRDVRKDLRRLVSREGLAALYVTHDRDDAFLVADRIAVMRDGAVVQVGTPMQVYRQPVSRFVADLLGQENVVSVMVLRGAEAGRVLVRLGAREYELPGADNVGVGPAAVALPPESVLLESADAAEEVVGNLGQVTASSFLGSRMQTEVETEVGTLVVHEWEQPQPRPVGQKVRFHVRAGRGWVMQG